MYGFEITLYQWIGLGVASFSGLLLVCLVLVPVLNLLYSAFWHWLDDGETKKELNWLSKAFPFLHREVGEVKLIKGKWCTLTTNGSWITFCNKEAAENYSETNSGRSPVYSFSENLCIKYLVTPLFLGVCIYKLPITTLYFSCAALSLFALKKARQGYKRVKELKECLDEHKQNTNAHKES